MYYIALLSCADHEVQGHVLDLVVMEVVSDVVHLTLAVVAIVEAIASKCLVKLINYYYSICLISYVLVFM